MAIDFPSTAGQLTDGSFTHTVNGVTWSWDGTTWKGLAGTFPTASATVKGGIKVGNSLTIDAATSVLDFGGTLAGDLTVDTNVLKVDTAQNQVGIGTASPNSLLHLYQPTDAVYITFGQGQHNTNYWLGTTGTTAGFFIEQGSSNNSLLTADASDYVSLYGAGTKRLETTSTGVTITGDLSVTGSAGGVVDSRLTTSTATSNQLLSWTGTAYDWVDPPASGGSPGGSNTQLQINNNGAFGGCNIEYNPTHLDGGLEWADSSGTPGAAIRVYHSSIGGGDDSMLFYTGGGLLGTINLRIFNNSVTVYGSLTKGGGSFRIPHPLPSLMHTKDLAHSFIEGPQCDNLYRGKVDLVGGTATIDIDVKFGMTIGTFVALNRDIQCFTSNETGWTAVKGSVSGSTLTITAQDNTCTDTISWMVVGERQDPTVKALDITDADGNLIVEPDQIPIPTI